MRKRRSERLRKGGMEGGIKGIMVGGRMNGRRKEWTDKERKRRRKGRAVHE